MRASYIISSIVCCLLMLAYTEKQALAEDVSLDATPDTISPQIKRKTIVIVKRRPVKTESQGVQLGSFILTPTVSLAEYYDDNVYATDSGTKHDVVTQITPEVNVKSNWKKHEINMNAGVEVTRFTKLTTENTENAWANIAGRYDINRSQKISADISYLQDHEDRASPDALAGSTPTKYFVTTETLGYAGASGNHFYKLIYSNKQFDFNDVTSTTGVINNDDRDRNENGIGMRYLYKYSANTAFFLKASVDKRSYNQTPDDNGDIRNSNGYQYDLGIQIVGTNRVSSLFIGQLKRDYKSSAFNDPSEVDFGLQHSWRFLPSSHLTVQVKRSIEETTLSNSPGYLMTDALSQLTVDLSNDQSVFVSAALSQAKYYGITRKDDYQSIGAGYTHKIFEKLTVGVDLHHATRNSDISGQDYKINQVFLRMKAAI